MYEKLCEINNKYLSWVCATRIKAPKLKSIWGDFFVVFFGETFNKYGNLIKIMTLLWCWGTQTRELEKFREKYTSKKKFLWHDKSKHELKLTFVSKPLRGISILIFVFVTPAIPVKAQTMLNTDNSLFSHYNTFPFFTHSYVNLSS